MSTCRTPDDCTEIFIGNCDGCPFVWKDGDDPPTWTMCGDPDRCSDCGSLLVDTGEYVYCPTCDSTTEPADLVSDWELADGIRAALNGELDTLEL